MDSNRFLGAQILPRDPGFIVLGLSLASRVNGPADRLEGTWPFRMRSYPLHGRPLVEGGGRPRAPSFASAVEGDATGTTSFLKTYVNYLLYDGADTVGRFARLLI